MFVAIQVFCKVLVISSIHFIVLGHLIYFDRTLSATVCLEKALCQAVVGPFYFLYGVLLLYRNLKF